MGTYPRSEKNGSCGVGRIWTVELQNLLYDPANVDQSLCVAQIQRGICRSNGPLLFGPLHIDQDLINCTKHTKSTQMSQWFRNNLSIRFVATAAISVQHFARHRRLICRNLSAYYDIDLWFGRRLDRNFVFEFFQNRRSSKSCRAQTRFLCLGHSLRIHPNLCVKLHKELFRRAVLLFMVLLCYCDGAYMRLIDSNFEWCHVTFWRSPLDSVVQIHPYLKQPPNNVLKMCSWMIELSVLILTS